MYILQISEEAKPTPLPSKRRGMICFYHFVFHANNINEKDLIIVRNYSKHKCAVSIFQKIIY